MELGTIRCGPIAPARIERPQPYRWGAAIQESDRANGHMRENTQRRHDFRASVA